MPVSRTRKKSKRRSKRTGNRRRQVDAGYGFEQGPRERCDLECGDAWFNRRVCRHGVLPK